MAVIQVENLIKRYDGRAVVDDISFEVEAGEIFAILGPNGAGKTTTVEAIAGLRRPDGGRIRVAGLDPETDSAGFANEDRFEVVGEAGSGNEALAKAAALRPDVVLMDLRMPDGDGVEAIRRIRERGLESRVLVLTTYDTERDVLPAIEAGATGYLLKDTPRLELLSAVEATARGEGVLSPPVSSRLMDQVRSRGGRR